MTTKTCILDVYHNGRQLIEIDAQGNRTDAHTVDEALRAMGWQRARIELAKRGYIEKWVYERTVQS